MVDHTPTIPTTICFPPNVSQQLQSLSSLTGHSIRAIVIRSVSNELSRMLQGGLLSLGVDEIDDE
jgi:hypothetical protein